MLPSIMLRTIDDVVAFIRPDRTLGWLVIASYFAEVVLMGYEIGVTGTITDPASVHRCSRTMQCSVCVGVPYLWEG